MAGGPRNHEGDGLSGGRALNEFLDELLRGREFGAVRASARDHRWPGDHPPITRFAPSPTGELHLGHVLHAIWVWGTARLFEARVVVRMEDHDRTRCRPEYEAGILTDLRWLGFLPDEEEAGTAALIPVERQSENPARYQAARERLASVTDLYACTCTRSALEPPGPDGERRYPGTCRGKGPTAATPHVLRVRLPDEAVSVLDLRLGMLRQHPQRDQGDVVIRDAQGQWTYQLCVVADDLAHDVNLIVRGEDLRASTGRQALLGRLLGRREPFVTVHHPLLYAPDGRKLSKRDRSETVRARREAGQSAGAVLREAWNAAAAAPLP